MSIGVVDQRRDRAALPRVARDEPARGTAQPVEPEPRADRVIDGAGGLGSKVSGSSNADDVARGGKRIEIGDPPSPRVAHSAEERRVGTAGVSRCRSRWSTWL